MMMLRFLCAVLVSVGLAPVARADGPSDAVVATYAVSVAPAVCRGLIADPDAAGILSLAFMIERDTGWDDFHAGEVIALATANYCPALLPLLRGFAHSARGQVL